MRVNVYAEEITDTVEMVYTVADTDKSYCGIRFYLASSEKLHHTVDDDDRSAVTLWAGREKLRELLKKALDTLEQVV